jgi:hypothetical protein
MLGAAMLLWTSGGNAQECPEGWKEVAQSFMEASTQQDVKEASRWLYPDEQEAWASWKVWEWERLERRISALPDPVQERAAQERAEALRRIEVSVFTCQSSPVGLTHRYLVRVDPDGRTFQNLNLMHDEGKWWVTTSYLTLGAEQVRSVTAYMQAVDDNRWEEAEAWVARQALPRFAGYRLEVESFLTGSEVFAQARADRVAKRKEEWAEKFIRAVKGDDGIIVVYVEFPTATELSCELIEVDGTWRILHR